MNAVEALKMVKNIRREEPNEWVLQAMVGFVDVGCRLPTIEHVAQVLNINHETVKYHFGKFNCIEGHGKGGTYRISGPGELCRTCPSNSSCVIRLVDLIADAK